LRSGGDRAVEEAVVTSAAEGLKVEKGPCSIDQIATRPAGLSAIGQRAIANLTIKNRWSLRFGHWSFYPIFRF
jgi:hypothetical protein